MNELLDKLGSYVEGDVSFTMSMRTSAAEKLKIYYSAEAYAKTVQLIFANVGEVAWNMVIKPYKDGYKVYDVVVCPQKDSAGYVEIDLNRYVMWKAELPDEIDANLFGYGHSHVNFDVIPSSRDRNQQKDEVISKGHGFYFFQIWNKRMEINSFFYDIDNNLLYEREDIEMIVETGDTTTEEFLAESRKMQASEPKPKIYEPKPVVVSPPAHKYSNIGIGKRKKKKHRSKTPTSDEFLDEYMSWYPNFEV